MINTASEDVDALDKSLRTCAGTTDEMAQTMMSGFGGFLEKLKSSIDVLVTSIGEALTPSIQKVAEFIQGLVDNFNACPRRNRRPSCRSALWSRPSSIFGTRRRNSGNSGSDCGRR